MRILKFWNLESANKAQIFAIDALFALIFIALLILVLKSNNQIMEDNLELLKMQKIDDLLITAQYLKIDGFPEIERNYRLLFPSTPGYIKINNTKKEINITNFEKTKIISNSIKYINNSNNKIYIEIGVYS
jgi:hypothetical protein